ncbi:MAG TPA: pyridoxal phosphate-dependent aminotransferase [Thermoanaerobaculia bacterium]|nr:pyridoxal phosphate-dependent aminotransferase [Thermoanaerobaculia bacterium]
MFSRRAHWSAPLNRLSLARRARGGDLLDLTESNPTRAELDYPHDELANVMASAARAPYDPQPLGLRSARETLSAHLGCDADDLVITASTSEAYSFLFKLLTDPGDAILTATPSYPLLEHLASLELVTLRHFPLELHRRWELADVPVDASTRAIVVVNPNNPTGSFVTAAEQDALAMHGLPIISDEVFRDYAFAAPAPSLVRDDVLTFALGGLSKSAGLPHYKLGWIRVGGPPAAKREAIEALELIADNFLSVATPVQVALPDLLRIGAGIRDAIRNRIRANLAHLTEAVRQRNDWQLLPVEAGWSAVIRIPRTQSDEDFALQLLEERGVLVHPGYFFDFPSDGYFVVSLLTPTRTFIDGIEKALAP